MSRREKGHKDREVSRKPRVGAVYTVKHTGKIQSPPTFGGSKLLNMDGVSA